MADADRRALERAATGGGEDDKKRAARALCRETGHKFKHALFNGSFWLMCMRCEVYEKRT